MFRRKNKISGLLFFLIGLTLALTACGNEATSTQISQTTAVSNTTIPASVTTQSPTTTAVSNPTQNPATTQVPNTTQAATTTQNPATTQSSPSSVSGNPAAVQKDLYLDDHSTPFQVLRSYYNAINRQEYVRAYSYWSDSNTQPYAKFEQGFKDTVSVELYTGQLYGGVAAGTTYYQAEVSLKSRLSNGTSQTFAGCFSFRFGNPANYGTPPFRPMLIDKAKMQQLNGNANTAQVMKQSCLDLGADGSGDRIINPTPQDNTGVAADHYLDSRSSPEDVIRSYYNSINRKELVRAYSYWSSNGQAQPYLKFEQGFKDTASVKIVLGKSQTDRGAGQIYTKVPVEVTASQSDNSSQIFSGCYTLHQAVPALYGAPPFVPIQIEQANLQPARAANPNFAAQSC